MATGLLGQYNWFQQPGHRGYAVMLVGGLLVSVPLEWLMVYVLERWAYAPTMPLIPWLRVGVTPIAQMVVLPPLIFWIVAAWKRIRDGSNLRRVWRSFECSRRLTPGPGS